MRDRCVAQHPDVGGIAAEDRRNVRGKSLHGRKQNAARAHVLNGRPHVAKRECRDAAFGVRFIDFDIELQAVGVLSRVAVRVLPRRERAAEGEGFICCHPRISLWLWPNDWRNVSCA
jgi:hypothetical protein